MHLVTILSVALTVLSTCEPCCCDAAPTTIGLENSPLTTVHALVGQSALLPCDVTEATSSKQPILVLFYYSGDGVPIYSVDARGSNIFSGSRWSSPRLGNRATFVVREDVQGLLLEELGEGDAGEYRCRVDFKSSPTKNFRIVLKIIVPPRHLLILSSLDEGRVVEGRVGPYPRGADLTLTCQVTGGVPPPSVVWWQAGRLLDSTVDLRTHDVAHNSLHLHQLGRAHVMRRLTCTAGNTNVSAPLTASVTLDVALPPTSVHIVPRGDIAAHGEEPASPRPLVVREDQETTVTCETQGSRPKAIVVWQKNDRVMDMQQSSASAHSALPPAHSDAALSLAHSSERDAALSTLKFVPSREDHGSALSCTAYSPQLSSESVIDSVTLHVLYPPKLRVTYQSPTEVTQLEVGDTFTLVCEVDGNPPPTSVTWTKDGTSVDQSPPPGVSVSGAQLVVAGATRQLSGAYACAAANDRGSGTSPPLTLSIKFAPECAEPQKTHYGAGLKEVIEVSCRVWAHPPPLSYRWALNTSAGLVDVAQNTFSNNGTISKAMYIAHTPMDFGSLLCWAANDVGLMETPCVFHVVPAAKPEAVENCRVHNNSSMPRTVALVTCTPGYDGGTNQTFSLEVREIHNPHSPPLAQVSNSPIPVFHLKNLKMGEPVMFVIRAVNARGSGPPVTLTYTAPHLALGRRAPHSYDSSNTTWIPWTIFIFIIFGGLTTALVCFCAALFFLKLRTPSRPKPAKIVYMGPVRGTEETQLGGTLSRGQADDVNCEEKQLLKVDFIPSSPSSSPRPKQPQREALSTRQLPQPRLDILPHGEEEHYNNSPSDLRFTSPNGWGPPQCCGDSYHSSYARSSLPSPPPPCHHSHSPPHSPSPNPTATPRQSPTRLSPSQASPTQPNPILQPPTQFSTSQPMSCQAGLSQASPTQAKLAQGTSTQAIPSQANPSQTSRTRSSPTQPSFPQTSPTQEKPT